MSAAARICAYLHEHGEATRPELQRVLDLGEKTIETASRKLLGMNMIVDSERTRHENGPRPAKVYILGSEVFAQEIFSHREAVGRPRGPMQNAQRHSFDALNAVMGGFFQRRTA